MNKNIAVAGSAAAALLLLSVPSISQAQAASLASDTASTQTQVPADHWAYAALRAVDLGDEVPGFPDHAFSGRAMTRQELAGQTKEALGRFLSRPTGTESVARRQRRDNAGRMERLVAEFAPELSAQGLDVPRTRIRLATVAAQNAEPSSDNPGVRPVGPVSPPFRDVPTDHWAYESVERLRKLGIIGGYPGGSARPQQTAPARQQRSNNSAAAAHSSMGVKKATASAKNARPSR